MTERFLEHQEEAKARVMQAIDDRQKREMELLEKMRKDDRDHELRLVQILGQMMFAHLPLPPLLYYPPPPVPQPPPDAHTSTYNSINN